MIVKLTCSIHPHVQPDLIRLFSRKAHTCLSSNGAFNTTPDSVVQHYGITLSYWYLDDKIMTEHYGSKISVRALTTYPGVISANILDIHTDEPTLKDMTQYELESVLFSDIP